VNYKRKLYTYSVIYCSIRISDFFSPSFYGFFVVVSIMLGQEIPLCYVYMENQKAHQVDDLCKHVSFLLIAVQLNH